MVLRGRAILGRSLLAVVLTLSALTLAETAAAGILDATWTAPTTNVDGTPLTNLASYRVYYSTSNAPCPGSVFVEVLASTASPGPNQAETARLGGLTAGTQQFVSVTAVDANGQESACSGVASAVARADVSVTPTGTVNFGNVNVGSFADQTFTVSNTGGGGVSGAVTTTAPFSVVSGGAFSLVGAGASQAVTVRFSPTSASTATGNVNFTANGGTISRVVTGVGVAVVGVDTTPPSVVITSPAAAYTTNASTVTLAGTASDNVGVTRVAWANNRGGSGTASGTTSWTVGGIVLQAGANVVTVTAQDAAANTATASVTITLDTTAPTLAITSPTSAATYTTTTSPLTLSGTASDDVRVARVTWANSRGGSGTATGTTSWTASGIVLQAGTNVLTVTTTDAAGNTASASVSVTFDTTVPSPTPDPSPTPGLIGYWMLDEQTGTIAADSSGNGNAGTRVNGPVAVPGAVGAALSLNGVNQYVRVPHTAALDAYPLTVAAWVKFGSTTGRGGIVNKYVIGAYNGYQIFTEGNGTLCAWYFKDRNNGVYDGTACTLKTVGYADNRWHRVVFVVDNAGGRLYVDGAVTASQAWTGLPGPATTTQPLELGVYPGQPGGWYFPGAVDDVRIYNRALSATGVQQLGTRTRGLIGYWKLDEQTGTVAADSSGYGRTGTRVNGAVSITGAVDAALALNGVNQYVLVPHTTALDAYPLSVAAWVKFGSTTGRGGIVNKYVIGAYNGYQVFTEGNGTLCAWYFKDRSNGVYDGTACTLKTVGYADDRWHRVVFVVDNAGGRLYVDGVLTASQAWTGLPGPATTTQPLELGVYPGLPGGWYFFGAVDDVRIYNRALSATEVATP